VVSPAELNDHLRTVLVAPMTTASHPAPSRIGVTHGGKRGLILLGQMRAVHQMRLAKKLGAVSAKTLAAALSALQEVFAE
jgi:mRNA interferase MazF